MPSQCYSTLPQVQCEPQVASTPHAQMATVRLLELELCQLRELLVHVQDVQWSQHFAQKSSFRNPVPVQAELTFGDPWRKIHVRALAT
jgi:hypothetical protein